MLDTHVRSYVSKVIKIGSKFFIKLNFTPNQITTLALIIGILAALVLYFDFKIISIVLLWISGYLDAVDGEMARSTNSISKFGTLMDITFDRIVEISIVVVIAIRHIDVRMGLIILLCTIIISMVVFLTVGALTDKDSKKSFYYQAGLMERTEGFLLFSIIILANKYMIWFIYLFSILVIITAIQRLLEARKIL